MHQTRLERVLSLSTIPRCCPTQWVLVVSIFRPLSAAKLPSSVPLYDSLALSEAQQLEPQRNYVDWHGSPTAAKATRDASLVLKVCSEAVANRSIHTVLVPTYLSSLLASPRKIPKHLELTWRGHKRSHLRETYPHWRSPK